MLTQTRDPSRHDEPVLEALVPTRRAAEIRATLQAQIESGQRPPGPLRSLVSRKGRLQVVDSMRSMY